MNAMTARFYHFVAPLSVREVKAVSQLSSIIFAPPCTNVDFIYIFIGSERQPRPFVGVCQEQQCRDGATVYWQSQGGIPHVLKSIYITEVFR